MRYYPILRGRMNELMAVRELAEKGRLKNVRPIIEPVKANPTLKKTLKGLSDNGTEAYFVTNPQVGTYNTDLLGNENLREEIEKLLAESSVKKCMVLNGSEQSCWLRDRPDLLLFTNENAWECERAKIKESGQKLKLAAPLSISFIMAQEDKIRVKDEFVRRKRNADYRGVAPEPFMADYSDIEGVGFKGFADYSVVGAEYAEGGFMPRAVAAHIVCPVDNEHRCEIHHFVSSEYMDADRDTAGKYGEVVEQINDWLLRCDMEEMRTIGMDYLIKTYKDGSFPGLGMLKRFTVMHHLELMDNLLDEWQ